MLVKSGCYCKSLKVALYFVYSIDKLCVTELEIMLKKFMYGNEK
jgi:hypothetical protein